jgi:hypothetical protein
MILHPSAHPETMRRAFTPVLWATGTKEGCFNPDSVVPVEKSGLKPLLLLVLRMHIGKKREKNKCPIEGSN